MLNCHFASRLLGSACMMLMAWSATVPVVFAQDSTTPLTLDQATTLAVEQSRLVAATREQGEAARDMQVSARQLPDPVLKAGLENVPADGPDRFSTARDFMTQRSIGVMQEFTREDKRQARALRYEREAQVAESQRELTVAQIRRDVAAVWLERSYRETARALLQDQAREAELQVDAADAAYRAGRGNQADVFAARTQVEQIRDRINESEQQIAVATDKLSRWLGAEAQRPLAPRPPMDGSSLPESVDEERVDRHPQLSVLSGQAGVAQAEADLARASRRSDWSWELTYSQRGSSYSNMVSLNVSVPVPWNRARLQDRELAARLAQRNQAQAEREDARRALVAESKAVLHQLLIERSRLQRYDASLLPLADQRTAAALSAYRSGSVPLTTVLEARRVEIETKLERVNVELEFASLGVQLRYLLDRGQSGVVDFQ